MHKHLQRLCDVWERQPVYFITTCVAGRRHVLANLGVHSILRQEWMDLKQRHGWAVGRYVVMPDHVHFFVTPMRDSPHSLAMTIGKWKEWTANRLAREIGAQLPMWQPEFFDHLLRSSESRSEKWAYVIQNPVRANLVRCAEDWPFAGSIDFE